MKEFLIKLRQKLSALFNEINYRIQLGTLTKLLKKEGYSENNELYTDDQFNETAELGKRNHFYTELLKSYVNEYKKNERIKNKKKWHFFNLVVFFFIVFLLLLIAMSIIVTIYFRENEIAVLVSYLTTFLGAFVSLAVIPNTIVKYLFNPKEDETITKMVISMQKQDNENKQIIKRQEGTDNAASDSTTGNDGS